MPRTRVSFRCYLGGVHSGVDDRAGGVGLGEAHGVLAELSDGLVRLCLPALRLRKLLLQALDLVQPLRLLLLALALLLSDAAHARLRLEEVEVKYVLLDEGLL